MRLGTIAETNKDVENGTVLDANIPSCRPTSEREPNYEVTTEALPLDLFNSFVDSFRRDKNQSVTPQGVIGADGRVYNPKNAALATANTALQRNLKSRHLQMIAFGGSIGTGLFIASGKALHIGGPASVSISFSLIGIMVYCTMQALGEMAVAFPVAGSFSAYSTRFLDPSWGFAMGWNYALQWLAILPLEITAASITINYWDESHKYSHAIFVSSFLVLIVSINLFGVRGYGEAEFVFSTIKITAIIGYIILGVILNCGGGPEEGYIGGKYWNNPGAFHNGFRGLCSVFVTAANAFAGTELAGLAAAETANPRKSIPTACKQIFWRVTLFYIVSLTIVGLLVPYTEPRLLQSGSAITAASPFVISIQNAGIEILPSVMNLVILIAVLSVGNSAIFGSSRTLAALAEQGQGPSFLRYVDRKGRPLAAICISAAVGLVAFIADDNQDGTVLDWLLAISGLSCIFTWASICLAHIRFRKAWARERNLSELPFLSQAGPRGSWLGFLFNCLILIAQFWTGAWPIDYKEMGAREQVKSFFLACLAIPVILVFYISHKLWFKTSLFIRLEDIDIDTGRRDSITKEQVWEGREERESWPRWKRMYKLVC